MGKTINATIIMTMIFGTSRLRYIFLWFFLTCFSAFRASNPTSARPGKASLTTGRPFNQPGTLPVTPYKKVQDVKGMVYIEGGCMIMGNLGEDKLGTGGCCAKPVTVNSFYMDQTPITNLDYREYLYDLKHRGLMEEYNAAMPNQQVFVEECSYNDPLVENYLEAPGFMYYPVVGVSWEQATQYCKWRTEKLREGEVKKRKVSKRVEPDGGSATDDASAPVDQPIGEKATYGNLVVRLPTEAEFEYAARAIIGVASIDYLQRHQRTYPWDGDSPKGKDGQFLANFKRGKGNYKGMAGESDHAAPTSYVYAYPPNDLGLYDMVGNVCCWVYDTYSPLALQETGDLNPVKRKGSLDAADNYHGAHNASGINDDIKVYKGCSWADCAYFLQIGIRRYLHKDAATATIGFRCVVSSLGR